MKEKIISILKEHKNKFVSGEEISNLLGVSRTSIWKVLKQLKASGYNIESAPKKGYKLLDDKNIYSKEEITLLLKSKGSNVEEVFYFDSINSTNEYAKEIGRNSNMENVLVISDIQTDGKGRLGRKWLSSESSGVWMSLLLKPNLNPTDASKITQIASAAIVTAIEEFYNLNVGIKWPNDIIINGKKIAGVLTEMNSELGEINFIVVGIGINVNTKSFPEEISDIASSLFLESGLEIDRKKIIEKVIYYFYKFYNEYIKNKEFNEVLDINKKKSVTLNRDVFIIRRNETFEAYAYDLNRDGELMVRDKDGKESVVFYGEVSIRGVAGYL
ncbi:biotin--[acetyl-CoA-carboxylase] ligase [Helicovermis profundi]|uniref:Bifunctional ligase/repressor BirA n=1 Tax=Helicovermis profundi TaxID=3065157 RepID=A0AAU9ES01_9FIRM|nr:biotin--[acetyl-CoA-carboxylase] ligase [Clostridia bacterium S502]